MKPLLDQLESEGFKPRHVFPPDVVIVEQMSDAPLSLGGLPAGSIFFDGPIDEIDRLALPDLRLEIEMIWNANYHGQAERYGLTPKTTRGDPLVKDALPPPLERKDESEISLLTDPGNPHGAADDNTSEYLSGKVAIAVFTVESNGNGENWDASRIATVKSEIQQGMNDLAAANPLSNLTFIYSYHDRCPTTIEPITMGYQAESIYIPECIDGSAFFPEPPEPAPNYMTYVRSADRFVRNMFGADWAVSMFVVDSLNDPDGRLADGYIAYAWLGGPHLVMTYDNDGWGIGRTNRVAQHEISHSFWALDEYSASDCSCSEVAGYLNAQNSNCEALPCVIVGVGCVMRSDDTSSECVHSRAQMGINDTDGDGTPDVRDTIPGTTLDLYPSPVTDATPTFTGTATDIALTNQNSLPYTPRRNITLNDISRVEYRVNGGAWHQAGAADGSFDWAEEGFTLTTGVLPPGTHTIEARARNSRGNYQPAPYASQAFEVTSPEFQNDLCSGAEVIPGAGPFPYLTAVTPDITYAASTGDPPQPNCSSSVSRSIWYKFVPASSGTYSVSSCSDATATTVNDIVIDIVTGAGGSCGGFSAVSGGCDYRGCSGEARAVATTYLTAGTTYFVVVYKRGDSPPSPGDTAVQLRVTRLGSGPPANDDCSGAEVIPPAGPFPYLTAVTANIVDATSTADPPPPTCSGSVSRSTWYRFVPATSGSYTISSCADAPTGTTVDDTVINIVTGSGGTCSGFAAVSGGCADHGCLMEGGQAVVTAELTSGTPYYIVAYKRGTSLPTAGNTAVQLSVSYNAPLANDDCSEAEVIPGSGPFPYLTAVTADITDATSIGDPPLPGCTGPVSRSIWYEFTPAASGSYTISSCADAPTATTVNDTVIDIVTGSGGTCGGFTPIAGGCDDQGCFVEGSQAVVTANLTAGTKYHIVIYNRGSSPSPGNTAVQLRVAQNFPPANDRCEAALPLALNIPLAGSTGFGADEYRSPNSPACFPGGQQQQTTDSRGRDAVYTFTAPAAGDYAFRVHGGALGADLVLYLSQACPPGAPPQTVSCLAGANRTTGGRAEEVSCVSLATGQSVYLFVDDRNAGFAGGPFVIEAESCPQEAEPNDTTGTAGAPACGMRGTMGTDEVDFFSLPAADTDWRVFAIADGSASRSTSNLDMRVTTATDTLEYDDRNNDVHYHDQCPNVGGTPLTPAPAFLRVDDTQQSEPYRLFAVTQPPPAFASLESEPNDALGLADTSMGDYYAGTLAGPSPSTDQDVFVFNAVAGDLIFMSLDGDPLRDRTPINATLELFDEGGTVLVAVDDIDQSSDDNPSPDTLEGTRPRSPAEAIVHRVASAGSYYARVGISPSASGAVGSGDYLLSITKNCLPSTWTDLSVSQGDEPDPALSGGEITYTITVSNSGPSEALNVELIDTIPAQTVFQSLTAPAGWNCTTPQPGETGDVTCSVGNVPPAQAGAGLLAPASAAITIVVGIDTCALDGAILTNTATVFSPTADADLADRSSSAQTTISALPDTDGDGMTNACDPDDDGDGAADIADCAPQDATAFGVPAEVSGLAFTNDVTLAWDSAIPASGAGTLHDVLRGTLGQLPVDSGPDEACLTPGGTSGASATDAATPASGTGRWYLVRGRNACGPGTYGATSDGAPRLSDACP